MEVAVVLSGVADPKWPLPRELSLDALRAHQARHAALSPFDEAALELALKLRDTDPAVRVRVLVAADETLARRVAGWRPDAVHRLDLAAVDAWDAVSVAGALAAALRALAPQAGVVLTGREFGDWDDGSVPAALACEVGARQIAQALTLERAGDALWSLRQAESGLERVCLPACALLSVTNDPGNRLRHPLMKNVMQARSVAIQAWVAPGPSGALGLQELRPVEPAQRDAACERFDGSAQDKARRLAGLLRAATAASAAVNATA